MMHILVTGGAGYLGSVFVPELLRQGHKVTVIDNFMYGQTSLLDVCHEKGLTIINGDARNQILVEEHLKGTDIIIPLACLTGAPICDRFPQEAVSINYDAVKMILELRKPEQKIIFPTTNSGYGIGEKGIYCTEKTPLKPISLYGQLKVKLERELLDHPNTITLRLATVFGVSPRMRIDLLVNDFTHRAVNDGFVTLYQAHYMRNYLHVRDVSRVFMHCMDHFDIMKGEAYNVGLSDTNISKWDLCEEIKKQIPSFYFNEADVGEDPDKRDYIVSNDKIESTGFKPTYSLQDGITELIKGYRIIKYRQFSNA